MNKKEKQQIKYLLENLKWYAEAPNEQDYNGEYEPPMEWEQGEAKIFLKYLEGKDKEIERLNEHINFIEPLWKECIDENENLTNENEKLHSIIKEVREEIIKDRKKNYDDLGKKTFYCNKTDKLLEILDKVEE